MTVDARVEYGKFGKKFTDARFAGQLLADAYAAQATVRITAAIKKEAPIGKHFDLYGNDQGGGELRDSLYPVVYHQGGFTQIMVKSKKEQTKYVVGGTKPHDIPVSNKPYLQFWWEKMDNDFPIGMWNDGTYSGPGTLVSHPGQRPNAFAKKGWMAIRTSELALFKASVLKQLGL
jgi:hypothetical protein